MASLPQASKTLLEVSPKGSSVDSLKVALKALSPKASLPVVATNGSAGYDIASAEEVVIPSQGWQAVGSGLALEMPQGFEAQLRPRSGLALRYGITLLNAPATIDSDYRGEIKAVLINHSGEPFTVEVGMRIAQLVFARTEAVKEFIRVDSLSSSSRGEKGFGSSGIK